MARRGRVYRRGRGYSSALSSAASSVVSSAVSTPWSSQAPSRACSPIRASSFRFMDLPAELRLKIYELALHTGKVVDLDPTNYRLLHPRLALFLVCKRIYEESYPVFYSQTIRLFPSHGRFFHTDAPLLARLPAQYRSCITTLELRLGPGWSAPPKCQKVSDSLGLNDCISLRTLKIFVEIDPSDTVFAGFRGRNATEDTYKYFCSALLIDILSQVPSLETVEIDAYPSVKKDAPMVMMLKRRIEEYGKRMAWGPLRGWEKDTDEPGLIGLEMALAGMGLSDMMAAPRMVEVQG